MTTKQSVKLSEAQESVIQCIIETNGRSAGNNPSTHTIKSLCNNHKMVNWAKVGEKWTLTDAGREYAQSKGWLASEEATVEAKPVEPVAVEKVLISELKVGDVLTSDIIGDKTISMIVEKPTMRFGGQSKYDYKLIYAEGGSDLFYDTESAIRKVAPVQEAEQPAPEPTQAEETGALPEWAIAPMPQGTRRIESSIPVGDVKAGDKVFYRGWVTVQMITHLEHGWAEILTTSSSRFTVHGEMLIERLYVPFEQKPSPIVTHTEYTPLAVLHEAIKALTGVNDPALRTRDCVERTERALGLLVDELLPMLERQQAEPTQLKPLPEAVRNRLQP